ncbi:MAG TPA: hypothetical protein VN665_03325 [Candidatus Paceibacterota bacterium]|nr:hypothetical protein [Candidatus Paceibacterota bacterium]
MAEIATFTCSNEQCRLTLRLARDFPLWNESRTTILRYRSETFCTTCNKTTEYIDGACIVCADKVTAENLGRACPRCAKGAFAMPHLSVL